MSDTLARRSVLSQGYGIIPKKAMRDKRLKPEAKAIYAYLCSFAGNDKIAYPSVSLMCDELGMGRDRFYKYRSQLEDMGYVEVRQVKDGTRFAKNVYVLLDGDIEDTESPCTENKDTENEDTENKDTNKNSSTSNSITSNNSTKNREIRKRKRFTPPTLQEVEDYVREKGLNVDAKRFWDYYEAMDWHDRDGKKVQRWKGKAITWDNGNKPSSPSKPAQKPEPELVRLPYGMMPASLVKTEEEIERMTQFQRDCYYHNARTYQRNWEAEHGNE